MIKILKISLVSCLVYFSSNFCNAQSIAINEVMASNATSIADEDGDFEDWLEIYNYGDVQVNLSGYGLSDSYDEPFKWVFPNVTIEPGAYLLIWTSGKNRTTPGAPLHTSYSIGAEGEEIILTEPSGVRVDELTPTAVPTDISYGKYPNGTGNWRFFTSATPGSENIGPGYGFLLSPPTFSHPDGMYTENFDLEITTSHEGATIYYSLDGSEPNENSTLYQGPINISSRIGIPNDISIIPTNNNNDPGPPYYEGWQPPLGEVFKINVVRARVVHPDAPMGNVVTYSYLVDEEGDHRYSLPIISLSTHRDNLFDDEIGIYVPGNYNNIFQEGDEWERPANITFLEKGGTPGFKENVGIRLHGNTTRSRPRKSIRVSSRSEYGNSWINYQVFPDKPIYTYKRLILRNSGNDWDWAVFRDAFIQYLAKNLDVGTQYYRPSIVFINGEYWGIHNIRDRYDEHYIFSHYGIEENEMTIMENDSKYKFGNAAGVDHYNNMLSFINSSNLSLETNYEAVQSMMDVESFIDFQLTHIFSMNTDWPGNNTLYWRYLRDGYDPNAAEGRDGLWRWLILDTDFGFGLPFFYVPGVNEGPAHNTLAMATEPNGPGWPNPPWSTFLLRKLLTNYDFKNLFINRYCDLLNTTFSTRHVVSVIDSISNLLEPEMQEHINRWRRPTSMSEWHDNVQVLRNFAQQRPTYQLQHIKQKFSLTGEAKVILNVSNDLYGYIQVNTIAVNDKTMGITNNPYPWTGTYFKGVPISLKAVAFPGYQFSHWEGASSSSNPNIFINPSSDIVLKAHFTRTDDQQLINYWYFGTSIPNDTPLETLDASYSIMGEAQIVFHSALEGYPFYSGHPNWRKASMERRNSPTSINYIPEGNNNLAYNANNMRGIQIKQPFTGDGGENTLFFSSPTTGFKDIYFRFAAINEGAASGLTIDYSVINGEPEWISDGLATTNYVLSSTYKLIEVDFSNCENVPNNPYFRIRVRFTGDNMTADDGNRVTFNNFSITGVSLNAFTINATASSYGTIWPLGNIGVFEGNSKTFTIVPENGRSIVDVIVDGESVLTQVDIGSDGIGHYTFASVAQDHTIKAWFLNHTEVGILNDNISVIVKPNPANSRITISSDNTISKVEIVSFTGRIQYSNQVDTREINADVSRLNQGIYLVKVFTNKGLVVKKLVISR